MTWADVVNDPQLSADACLCLLHLMTLGEGEHEVNQRTWRRVLRHGSRNRARDALADLVDLGHVRRVHGGRRPDRWVLTGQIPSLKNLTGQIPSLNEDLTGQIPSLKPFDRSNSVTQTPTGVDEVMKDDGEDNSAREISLPAQRVLEKYDDVLTGCRDSVRDYLATRVAPDRQRAYAYLVVAILNGDHDLRSYEGRRIYPTQAQMGDACRELLTTDEIKMKAPVGDIRNLKTKLRFICRQGESHDPNSDTFAALDAVSQ